jgi:hypothetical protein
MRFLKFYLSSGVMSGAVIGFTVMFLITKSVSGLVWAAIFALVATVPGVAIRFWRLNRTGVRTWVFFGRTLELLNVNTPTGGQIRTHRMVCGMYLSGWQTFMPFCITPVGEDRYRLVVVGRVWPHRAITDCRDLSYKELTKELFRRGALYLPKGDYSQAYGRKYFRMIALG